MEPQMARFMHETGRQQR